MKGVKILKKIVCLLVCILLLTGCSMRAEYSIGINKDKSVDLGISYALDNELIDLMLSDGEETTQTYTDDERWEMIESSIDSNGNPEDYGFISSRYTDGEFKGMTFTKTFESIDSLVSNDANLNLGDIYTTEDIKMFTESNGTYTMHLYIDSESTDTSGMSTDFMEGNLVITLPNEPIYHNATSVSEDGKTLTWDLVNFDGDIQLEFKISVIPWNYIIIGAIALVVIIILIVVINLINKNKKKKQAETSINSLNSLNQGDPVSPVNNSVNTVSSDNNSVNLRSVPSEFEVLDNTSNIAEPSLPTDEAVVNINLGTDNTNNFPENTIPDRQNNSNIETVPEEPKTFSFRTISSNQPSESLNNNSTNQNNNLQ